MKNEADLICIDSSRARLMTGGIFQVISKALYKEEICFKEISINKEGVISITLNPIFGKVLGQTDADREQEMEEDFRKEDEMGTPDLDQLEAVGEEMAQAEGLEEEQNCKKCHHPRIEHEEGYLDHTFAEGGKN